MVRFQTLETKADPNEIAPDEMIRERMKQVREAYGLNQVDFSRALGVTNAHISKIEKGGCIPSKRLIRAICKEYGVNEMWLTTGTGEMFGEKDGEEEAVTESHGEVFWHFVDTYPYITECIQAKIKSEDDDLMKVLKILDIIWGGKDEGPVYVRTALDILEDAKAILLETVTF